MDFEPPPPPEEAAEPEEGEAPPPPPMPLPDSTYEYLMDKMQNPEKYEKKTDGSVCYSFLSRPSVLNLCMCMCVCVCMPT